MTYPSLFDHWFLVFIAIVVILGIADEVMTRILRKH